MKTISVENAKLIHATKTKVICTENYSVHSGYAAENRTIKI